MHNSMTAWRNGKENSSGRFLTTITLGNSMTARFRRRMSVDLPIVLGAGRKLGARRSKGKSELENVSVP